MAIRKAFTVITGTTCLLESVWMAALAFVFGYVGSNDGSGLFSAGFVNFYSVTFAVVSAAALATSVRLFMGVFTDMAVRKPTFAVAAGGNFVLAVAVFVTYSFDPVGVGKQVLLVAIGALVVSVIAAVGLTNYGTDRAPVRTLVSG